MVATWPLAASPGPGPHTRPLARRQQQRVVWDPRRVGGDGLRDIVGFEGDWPTGRRGQRPPAPGRAIIRIEPIGV